MFITDSLYEAILLYRLMNAGWNFSLSNFQKECTYLFQTIVSPMLVVAVVMLLTTSFLSNCVTVRTVSSLIWLYAIFQQRLEDGLRAIGQILSRRGIALSS